MNEISGHCRLSAGRWILPSEFLNSAKPPSSRSDESSVSRFGLVIQTHGFSEHEFWINGPWNSAFAAQPLATRDIVVLQVGRAIEKGPDAKAQGTPQEAPRQMGVYEGAIDYLDGLGIINRELIGIIGFSRTVYRVEYTLTHSTYHFAAATCSI
jgi:hypothetical protein